MEIDLCNLAKQLADGDISEDEFKHQRTKIIQYISQGNANGVTDVKAREHISRDDVPAENDDIFYQVAQLAHTRSSNRNKINLFVALPIVLLIGMAITLMLVDTSAFENNAIPVKHPVSVGKKQQLTLTDQAPQTPIDNRLIALQQSQDIAPVQQAETPKPQSAPEPNTTIHDSKTTSAPEQTDQKSTATTIKPQPALRPNTTVQNSSETSTPEHKRQKSTGTKVAHDNMARPIQEKQSVPEKSDDTRTYQTVALKPAALTNTTAKSSHAVYPVNAEIANDSPVKKTSLSSSEVSGVVEEVVASPSLRSEPEKQVTKPTMAEIQQLLARFTDAYENGDLELFTSLFAKNAKTNDQTNRNGIRKEYQQVFNGTEGRQMFLTDFNWDLYNGEAEGKGRFELLISPKNAANVQKYIGEVELILKREDNRVVISKMRHTEKSDS